MQIDISLAISIAAFILSLFTVYFQWFRVRGAKIDILNANDAQRSVPRPYSGLPKNIQADFPDYPDLAPGYALVKVVFGNSGDRAGIASIQNIRIKIKDSRSQIIKVSYYSYALVPAYDIIEKEILLRNIPIGPLPLELQIELTTEYGGYHPRSGQYLRKGIIEKTLLVSLPPGDEKPVSPVQATRIG